MSYFGIFGIFRQRLLLADSFFKNKEGHGRPPVPSVKNQKTSIFLVFRKILMKTLFFKFDLKLKKKNLIIYMGSWVRLIF